MNARRAAGAALILALLGMSACAGVDEKQDKIAQEADFHYKLGAGYFENQQISLAIRELTLALERNPNHLDAHYLLGFIYMGRRNYNKAVTHYKRLLELKPEHHSARNSLGATYLAMSRWKDAEEVFLILLDEPLYTSPELVHNNLGWSYYNQKRYNDALEHFKMATFLKPQFCLGFNNLGLTLEALKNPPEAARHYGRAIELCPKNYAEPHFNLGKLLAESNRAQARDHFQRCAELEPLSNLGDRCRQYLQAL